MRRVRRLLATPLWLAVPALAALGALAIVREHDAVHRTARVTHSYEVRLLLARIEQLVEDAESRHLARATLGRGAAPDTLGPLDPLVDSLQRLTAGDPGQQRRVASLHALAHRRRAELAALLSDARVDSLGGAAAIRAARGTGTVDSIRSLAAAIRGHENALLRERLATQDHSRGLVTAALLALTGVACLVAIVGVLSVQHEYRERRATLQALARSEDRYRSVVADVQDVIFQTDAGGRWSLLNPAWTRITGAGVDECLGRSCLDFLHPDDTSRAAARLAELAAGERETCRQELRFLTRDGAVRVLEVHARALRDADGELASIAGTLTDISARVEIEQRQRRDDARMRQVIEDMPIAVAMFDRDMRYLFTSRRWRKKYGFADLEITGMCHYDLVPGVPDATRAVHRRCLAGAIERADEERVLRPDGSEEWFRWEVRPWREHTGDIGGVIIATENITHRKRAEQERLRLLEAEAQQSILEANEERYRTLAEAIPEMVWTARPDGSFDYFNRQWYEYTGLSPADSHAGRGWHTVIHPDDVEQCLARWRESCATGRVHQVECRFRRAGDGTYRWHLGRAVPVYDEAGAIAKWIGTCTDIDDQKRAEEALRHSREELERVVAARTGALSDTVAELTSEIRERERAEEALREAKDAAEEANRAKSDFLARMSHELRTPLNSVIGFANVLLKNRAGSMGPTELSYVGRIATNGTHLLGLINDILDLAKIEAGRAALTVAPVALDALIAETVAQMEGTVRDRDVQLLAQMPSLVAPVDADAQRLRQVLINLVSNALRFTEHGSVTVRLGADPVTRLPTRIDVVDTGIGIPRARQAAIFEPFEQADRGTARRFGGTGLGLAISRSLCEMMGYRLDIQSEPGVGSTFSIVFPSRRARERPAGLGDGAAAHAGAGSADAGAPPLALVVDDDPDSRVLLGHLLEEFGCRVVSAVSAADGLRLAREQRPSVITVDLLMPTMSGWEMVERLRADPALREVAVIVVSIVASEDSHPAMEHVQRLDKPVSREHLFAALERTPAARAAAVPQREAPAASRYRGVREGASA